MKTANNTQIVTEQILGRADDGFKIGVSVWTCPADAGALLDIQQEGISVAEIDGTLEIAVEDGKVVDRWAEDAA